MVDTPWRIKAKQFWKEKLLSSFLFRTVSKGLDLASKKQKVRKPLHLIGADTCV